MTSLLYSCGLVDNFYLTSSSLEEEFWGLSGVDIQGVGDSRRDEDRPGLIQSYGASYIGEIRA